jgi:uncharacterized protein involved in tolerance to divalent cations
MSTYVWAGTLEHAEEVLMMIKLATHGMPHWSSTFARIIRMTHRRLSKFLPAK